MSKKAHVSDTKKKTVAEITKLFKENPIIGLVNMENLPSKQLQGIISKLRGDVLIKMSKKRLIKIAIENAKTDKKGIEELETYLKGMPALIFTDKNPFELFKTLKKNKSSAPAKAGQIAPIDVIIKAGATPFAPGPIIGELGSIGLKTKIEGPKIHITEDSVVVKEGELINEQIAGILSRLDIKPIEVGLNLLAVYKKGKILTKEILDIDEEKYLEDLKTAHSEAYTLAVELSYPVKETIKAILGKIHGDAKTLALEQEIITDETTEDIMKKAELRANNLKSKIPEIKTEKTEDSKEKEPSKKTEDSKENQTK